jgi:glycolate dehydrogenase FAD-binding subunit
VPTLEPFDAADAARALGAATGAGDKIVIRGAGTKSHRSAEPPAPRTILSTARLNRVLAHRDGDLTATVESGASLGSLNRELSRRGQWLPLDPAWADRATIGGLVATNDAGPRRHRYGAPRDLIIGIEIARCDGVRAKAGGIVVKNVAGYDVSRLFTGSCGTLGLILNATFKLYPLPAASRTVIVQMPDYAAAGAIVNAVSSSQLTPTAVEVATHPFRLLIRFESTERSVQHQAEEAVRLAAGGGGRAEIAAGAFELRTWVEHGDRPWTGRGIVLKIAVLPVALAATLDAIAAASGDREWEAIGRAGLGVVLLRVDADGAAAVEVIRHLRDSQPIAGGSLVVLRASQDVRIAAGSAVERSDAFAVMQEVKRVFDPRGTLPGISALG